MDRDGKTPRKGNNAPNNVSDDDLDLSELLEKYMLEPLDKSSKQGGEADKVGDALDEYVAGSSPNLAEDLDANVYSEWASEVYTDEDARRAATKDAAVLDEYVKDVEAENNGVYGSEKDVGDVLDEFDSELDYSYDDGVYGDNEDDPLNDAVAETVEDAPGSADETVDETPGSVDGQETAGQYETVNEEYVEDAAPAEGEEYVTPADAGPLQDETPAPEENGYYDVPADNVSAGEQFADNEAYDNEAYEGETDAAYDAEGSYETEEQGADESEPYVGETDGLYVDGSEYADELADLSTFAGMNEFGDETEQTADADAAATEGTDTAEASADASADEAAESGESAEGDFVDYEAKEEQIDIDENVDSTDINLMLAFGLDDELERTMGAENALRLTKELDEEQRKRDEHARKLVDNEYMNRSQTAGIAKDYKRRYTGDRIKLAIAAVLSVVLFFYENLRLFKLEFSGAFDASVYPTVYIMGSLQILLIIAACAYEQIFAGFVRLFKGNPDHRSVTAIAVTMAVIYSAVLPGVTTIAHKPLVLNFSVALLVLFTLVAELYTVRREIYSFNIVSSKKPKHVITKDDILDPGFDTSDGDALKFETAAFVDGFFTRTNEPVKASKTYALAAIVIALCSAALAGIITNIVGSGGTLVGSVIENSFCGFFIALPASMMIAAAYPFFRAARNAYDIDGAIIGECSLEEYSNASCVTFDDVGVFPSYGVRVQNIKIYNNHRIDRVLYYAASVFSVARGPLTDVFDMATVEIGHSDEVKIRAAGSGYLSATVDEKNITFGSAAELITRGFDIPENVTDEDDFDDEDVSVMYMFREDRLMAKLFIKYTIDADFETIMASLCDEGISVSIKTYDPNIDHDLIAAGLTKKTEYSYTVTRYDGADDGSNIRDNADSGIVSRSGAKTLLQLISDCTKVLASRRSCTIIGLISAAVAALILLVVIATGNASSLLPGRMSAIIGIYQLFWMIPAYISSKIHVR